MSIADFVVDKMSSYVAGGMRPETAAQSTRGELLAIYRRQHRSRDKSGAWQTTPPPENIYTPAAMKKADAALDEILKYCAENAEAKRTDTHGTAPENTQGAKKRSGLAQLRDYIRRETA